MIVAVLSGLIILIVQLLSDKMDKIMVLLGIEFTSRQNNAIAFISILILWAILTTTVVGIGNSYKDIILKWIDYSNGDKEFAHKHKYILNISSILLCIGVLLICYSAVGKYLFKVTGLFGISSIVLKISMWYYAIGGIDIAISSLVSELKATDLLKKYKFICYYYMTVLIIPFIYLVYLLIV